MRQFHIRLPDEVVDLIDCCVDGDETMTVKIRDYICSELIQKEHLISKKKEYMDRLEQIESLLANNKFCDVSLIPDDQREFIKGSIKTIDRNPMFINGQRSLYMQKFKKRVTLYEFRLLVELIKKDGSK